MSNQPQEIGPGGWFIVVCIVAAIVVTGFLLIYNKTKPDGYVQISDYDLDPNRYVRLNIPATLEKLGGQEKLDQTMKDINKIKEAFNNGNFILQNGDDIKNYKYMLVSYLNKSDKCQPMWGFTKYKLEDIQEKISYGSKSLYGYNYIIGTSEECSDKYTDKKKSFAFYDLNSDKDAIKYVTEVDDVVDEVEELEKIEKEEEPLDPLTLYNDPLIRKITINGKKTDVYHNVSGALYSNSVSGIDGYSNVAYDSSGHLHFTNSDDCKKFCYENAECKGVSVLHENDSGDMTTRIKTGDGYKCFPKKADFNDTILTSFNDNFYSFYPGPNIVQKKGYYSTDASEDGGEIKGLSIGECRRNIMNSKTLTDVEKNDIKIIGHRNSNIADEQYKNSCFWYTTPADDDWLYEKPTKYSLTCKDQTKSWPCSD